MIDMRYKPYFLPQISAPFDIVVKQLNEENVDFEFIEVDPNELEPMQGVTFSDEVEKVDLSDMNPIWINNDMKILDGHHRWVKALLEGIKLKAIKINMNEKDACRLLNKIQDLYDYTNMRDLEETTNNDIINDENNPNNNYTDRKEFLSSLEENNDNIQAEEPNKNPQAIMAYRKEPIKENSAIGNFFLLTPVNGYTKYYIEFDNLLDTNYLDIEYKDGQNPIDVIAKIWFPNINFEKISKENNISSINLKAKAIVEKALKLGYDGIKYGNKLLQGLK